MVKFSKLNVAKGRKMYFKNAKYISSNNVTNKTVTCKITVKPVQIKMLKLLILLQLKIFN